MNNWLQKLRIHTPFLNVSNAVKQMKVNTNSTLCYLVLAFLKHPQCTGCCWMPMILVWGLYQLVLWYMGLDHMITACRAIVSLLSLNYNKNNVHVWITGSTLLWSSIIIFFILSCFRNIILRLFLITSKMKRIESSSSLCDLWPETQKLTFRNLSNTCTNTIIGHICCLFFFGTFLLSTICKPYLFV